MTWLFVIMRVPGRPSIRTTTPDPDSSVGLVLPGAGGLTAATEPTLGDVWRMTASKRSPRTLGASGVGVAVGGAGRPWAFRSVRKDRSAVPTSPPRNAQLANAKVVTNRFIAGVESWGLNAARGSGRGLRSVGSKSGCQAGGPSRPGGRWRPVSAAVRLNFRERSRAGASG